MALREEGSRAIEDLWVVLRKLNLDDKRIRGDFAFFMVWRSGYKKYVETYETK